MELPLDRPSKLDHIVRNLGAEHIRLRTEMLEEPDLFISSPGAMTAPAAGLTPIARR